MAAAILTFPWGKGPGSRGALQERCLCITNSRAGDDELLLVINQGITSTLSAGVNCFGGFAFFFFSKAISVLLLYCKKVILISEVLAEVNNNSPGKRDVT